MIQTVEAAVSSRGYFSSGDPYFKFQLGLETISQNIEQNTTRVRIWVGLDCKMGKSSAVWSGYNSSMCPLDTISYSLDDGATWVDVVTNSKHIGYTSNGGGLDNNYTEMDSWSGDIPHTDDGTRTIKVRYNWKQGTNSVKYDPKTNSQTMDVTLPTIARASSISMSDFTISNSSQTFAFTVTSKASFYHVIKWSAGTVSNSSNGVVFGSTAFQGTRSGSVQAASILAAVTNAKTAAFNITVYTYSDAGLTNLIGSKTAQCTLTITNAFAPTVSYDGLTPYDYPNESGMPEMRYFIAGYSKARANVYASAKGGASIARIEYSASGCALDHSEISGVSSDVITTQTLPTNGASYNATINVTAIDSRGFEAASRVSIVIPVYGYRPPELDEEHVIIYRCKTSDTSVPGYNEPDDGGKGVWVEYSAEPYRESEDSGAETSPPNNAIYSLTCVANGTPYASGQAYPLNEGNSITFTVSVRDYISGRTITINVPTAEFPLDLFDDGAGNIGVAFGGVAEGGKVKSSLPIYGDLVGDVTGDLTGNADTATEADHATDADTATTATKSTKQEVSTANPAASTTYYPAFYQSQSGDRVVYANDGLKYLTLQGTASALGYGGIRLGNATNQGTAGNKWGFADFYPQIGAYYARIRTVETLTANRTFYLPDIGGTLALAPLVTWTGTAKGGAEITINLANCSKARVYAVLYNVTCVFDVDLTTAPPKDETEADNTSGKFVGSGSALSFPGTVSGSSSYVTGQVFHYFCVVTVPSAKNKMKVHSTGYSSPSYNRYYPRNNNVAYYVFKVEGYA